MSYGPEFTATTALSMGIRHSKISLREALEGVDEQAWYATYGSTLTLLSLVHACYLRHMWAVRKHTRQRYSRSRSTTVVSYHKVVHRKQFHLLIGAVLSHHPNPEANTSYSSTRSSVLERSRLDLPAGNHREELMPTTSSDPVSTRQHLTFLSLPLPSVPSCWLTFFNNGPFRTGNILQGLPLLFYCAHCLWACRALEVIYRGADYTSVLWTLTWTAYFLDFAFTRMALGVVRELNFATSAPFAMDVSPRDNDNVDSGARSTTIASRVDRTLMHRSIGSLTATTAAVLFLFQNHFDAPIPILPFLSIKGSILGNPVVSWVMIMTILLRLSHSTHPVMGVACGTISGLFWVSGWTFWLAERYWSCGMLMLYLGLCVLSLKLHGKVYLPFLDYVPWNRDGQLVRRREEGGEALMGMNQASDNFSIHSEASPGDCDAEDEEENAIELAISSRRPQTDRPYSSSTTTFLTGRSERQNDVERGTEHVPLLSAVSASLSMRSRRVPAIGRR